MSDDSEVTMEHKWGNSAELVHKWAYVDEVVKATGGNE